MKSSTTILLVAALATATLAPVPAHADGWHHGHGGYGGYHGGYGRGGRPGFGLVTGIVAGVAAITGAAVAVAATPFRVVGDAVAPPPEPVYAQPVYQPAPGYYESYAPVYHPHRVVVYSYPQPYYYGYPQ